VERKVSAQKEGRTIKENFLQPKKKEKKKKKNKKKQKKKQQKKKKKKTNNKKKKKKKKKKKRKKKTKKKKKSNKRKETTKIFEVSEGWFLEITTLREFQGSPSNQTRDRYIIFKENWAMLGEQGSMDFRSWIENSDLTQK